VFVIEAVIVAALVTRTDAVGVSHAVLNLPTVFATRRRVGVGSAAPLLERAKPGTRWPSRH